MSRPPASLNERRALAPVRHALWALEIGPARRATDRNHLLSQDRRRDRPPAGHERRREGAPAPKDCLEPIEVRQTEREPLDYHPVVLPALNNAFFVRPRHRPLSNEPNRTRRKVQARRRAGDGDQQRYGEREVDYQREKLSSREDAQLNCTSRYALALESATTLK